MTLKTDLLTAKGHTFDNPQNALFLLDDVVATSPQGDQTVYQKDIALGTDMDSGCLYNLGGVPGCIVGQAMHELGLDVTKMQEGGIGHPGVLKSIADQGVDLSADVIQVFQVAQIMQDQGQTWGAARSAAKAYHDVKLISAERATPAPF